MTQLAADASLAEEASYPGVGARVIELWLSESGDDKWVKAATLTLKKKGKQSAVLPANTTARCSTASLRAKCG